MLLISIRAPARGATGSTLQCFRFVIQFQSALPRGERRSGAIRLNNFFIISIRAPARGATITSNRSVRLIRISIRAPARGATCTFTHILSIRQFQSALPRGERQGALETNPDGSVFQSALPRGERHFPVLFCYLHRVISIRAPARGATAVHTLSVGEQRISIRAPARGATVFGRLLSNKMLGFQSALPRGERL